MLPARLMLCAALLLAALPASPAFAAAPTAAERESARVKGEEGLKLFGAEKYEEALVKFGEAYALVPAPSLKLYMARCQRKIGKLVEARDLYEQIVLEVLPADPPAAYTQAQAEAKSELEALRRRIPILQIKTTGVPLETVRAAVDGHAAPVEEERIELNPGEHMIDVMSPRAKVPARRSVTLVEGSVERVELALEPALEPADTRASRSDASTPIVSMRTSPSGSIVPGLVVLGMGAVNVGVGGVMGILSKAKVDELAERCPNNTCRPEDEPQASAAKTMGDIATVNLVVGGVGVIAGTVLLLTRSGGTSSSTGKGTLETLHVAVGPGSVGLSGTF